MAPGSGCKYLLLLLGLLIALSAHAETFSVGGLGAGCTYTTVQAAIDAANTNPGPDIVRLTRTRSYTEQQIVVTTQDLDLEGGFANCLSSAPDGTRTVLDGTDGAAAPVLTINPSGSIRVRVRGFQISGGDSLPDGGGGGVRVVGRGTLEISDSIVSLNDSGTGGGIYFRGQGLANSELFIGRDVLISRNYATRSGGGVYVEGAKFTMTSPRSSIANNVAVEHGGGVRAYNDVEMLIGSAGQSGLSTIYNNQAGVGGGLSLQAKGISATDVRLELRASDPLQPVTITDNVAFVRGGAIDLQPEADSKLGFVSLRALDAVFEDNVAPIGAVLFLSNQAITLSSYGAFVELQRVRIAENASRDSASVPTDGALIVATEGSYAQFFQIEFRGNTGGPLLRSGNASIVEINDSLIADNTTTSGSLLSIDGTEYAFRLRGLTIAGNTLPAGEPVIWVSDDIDLRRAIIWQPGSVTLQAAVKTIDDVLASETASLGNSNSIVFAPPRFLDPERGDYHLQAASAAVDFAGAGTLVDLDDKPRDVDLARVENYHGTIDLGAYERRELGHLVLNPGFFADLRRWTPGIAGSNAERTAAGAFSTGAVTLTMRTAPGGEFLGLAQCVRMPGPGLWRLSGYAYGIGGDALTRDRPILRWRLVTLTDDETCNGPLAAESNIAFPNATSWGQASALIDIPAAQFTDRTAIEIQLRVREGNLNIDPDLITTGHFDGIVLEAANAPPSALPFRDGFE